MVHPIESFEHNGLTVNIYQDDDPPNPRKDWDHTATFACSHRRYNLGDVQVHYESEEELRERIPDVLAVMPLYLYDHSGLTVSCKPFGCRFDSGQVGWAYVTRQNAKAMGFEIPEATDVAEEKFFQVIEAEVKEYDQYLRGDCYYFTIEGRDGDTLDSCGGFYGLDYAIEEAKSAADHADDPALEDQVEELSKRATYAGAAP